MNLREVGGFVERRHASLGLALALCLGLSACGIGQRQNPVASDGELGSTQAVQVDEDKPASYTTRSGDTLAAIAGRPEIYGDPALWPLLQGANLDNLAGKGSVEGLESGLLLQVPRGATPQSLAQAREQDRQVQAAAKARLKPKHKEKAKALPAPPAPKAAAKPKAVAKAPAAAKPAAAKPVAAKPAPTAIATAAPGATAQPVPKARASGMRPLLLLLLVLLAVGAVLWAFARKDRDDGA
jgi:hypothetical protein